MRTLLICIAIFQGYVTVAQEHRFAPDFAVAQYAGSIGFFSVGAGYDVFGKHELSIHYGYVPENRGGRLNILASKLVFNTYSFNLSERVRVHPLNVGAMLSYHFGSQFRSHWPGHRYPDGYYWWKTSLKAHLLTQSSVTVSFRDRHIRSMAVFVELNTNELYLISLVQNRHSLRLADIVKVGCGVRANF